MLSHREVGCGELLDVDYMDLQELYLEFVIGYDRYNVIVKGLAGTKITPGKAFILLCCIWIYAVGITIGPFFGWRLQGRRTSHHL